MRLSAEMFQQIAEALTSDIQSDRDKRQEPRVGMAGEATMVSLLADGRHTSLRVRIRDISHSGVGIYYNKKFNKGQRFIIQLQSVHDESIWLVCVTAYCRRAESDRYVLGGRIQQLLKAEQIERVEFQATRVGADVRDGVRAQWDMARIAKAILS